MFDGGLNQQRRPSLLNEEVENNSNFHNNSYANSALGPAGNPLPFGGFDEDEVIVPMTKQRTIPKIPYKVLDAPSLLDDFYLNLVDWSD